MQQDGIYTCWDYVIEKRAFELVKVLVEAGADIEAKGDQQRTAFLAAIRYGAVEIAEYLIQKGADMEAEDCEGDRALDLAAYFVQPESIELLIKYRANNPFLANRYCYHGTPKETAIWSLILWPWTFKLVKKIKNIALLNAYEKDYRKDWVGGLLKKKKYKEIKERMIKNPSLLEAKDGLGYTPLLRVLEENMSRKKQIDFVEFFIRQGADPNVKGNTGYTCLGYAIQKGSLELVKMLVEAGADIEQRWGQYNDLPLSSAILHVPPWRPDIIAEYLIQKGAAMDARDEKGMTLLHQAAMSGWPGKVKFLIKHRANPFVKNDLGQTPKQVAEKALDNRRKISSGQIFQSKDIKESLNKIGLSLDSDHMADGLSKTEFKNIAKLKNSVAEFKNILAEFKNIAELKDANADLIKTIALLEAYEREYKSAEGC